MDREHTLTMNADYVLGLLTAEERRRVEAHTRHCPGCRLALQHEQSLEPLVRGIVRQVARPAPGRLAVLRPSIPAPKDSASPFYLRLAPVTLMAVMLMMGLMLASGRFALAPALYATAGTPTQTATSTQTPTATLAEVDPAAAGPLVTQPPPGAAGPATSRITTTSPGAPTVAATPIIHTAAP